MVLTQVMPMRLSRICLPANGFDDMLAIEYAYEAVDARGLGEQLCLVTLYQATGDDYPPATAGLFQVDRLLNLAKRFGPGLLKKPAGVDDDSVRFPGVGSDGQSVLCQKSQHSLAVNQVLGAAEAYERDGLDWFGLVHGMIGEIQDGRAIADSRSRAHARGPETYRVGRRL